MGVTTSKRSALLSPGELRPLGADGEGKKAWLQKPRSSSQFQRWAYCQTPSDGAARGAPSPRSGHTVCLLDGKVYLFGGCGRAAGVDDYCLNDLHALDVQTLQWERIEPRVGERPAVRRSAAMCSIGDGRFLLSGGAGDDPDHLRSDLYVFDVHARSWTKLLEGDAAKPFCLCGQSAVQWKDTVLFFGGSTGLEYSNELYQYNLKTNRWRQLATRGPRPTPRYKHQAFIHHRYMYVIGGGCFKPLCEDADVHRLDLESMEWSTVAARGAAPMARVAHTCAYDSEDGAVYMWGGFTAGLQCLRNFYKLALDSHVWTAITPPHDEVCPSARSFHGSVFSNGCVYILSGSNGSEKFSDVWRYAIRESPPPLLTLAARAVLCQAGGSPHTSLRISLHLGRHLTCRDGHKLCCSQNGSLVCRRRHHHDTTPATPSPTAPATGHFAAPASSKWQQHWPFCDPDLRAPLAGQHSGSLDALPQELVAALARMNLLAERIV